MVIKQNKFLVLFFEIFFAAEIITVDVYRDNKEIILSGVEKIEKFIKEVIPKNDKKKDIDICRTSIKLINSSLKI